MRGLTALALAVTLAGAAPTAAQVFQGPPINKSFVPAEVKDHNGLNISVFYVKFVPYEGKVAVCGGHIGPVFTEGANKLFLRGSTVGNGTDVIMRNPGYMADLSRMSARWQADIKARSDLKRLRRAAFPASDYSYVQDLPSVCKVARRTRWDRDGAGREPVTTIKMTRITTRRSG